MKNSSIQWCDDTFNPWIGCAKVAPECKNCYAEEQQDHRYHRVKWGKGHPRSRTGVATWKQPLAWNRDRYYTEIQTMSVPRRGRVFCLSLGDWLDEEVPIEWLADLLALIHATPNLDWLLLTKRPENFFTQVRGAFMHCMRHRDPRNNLHLPYLELWTEQNIAPSNVWIGVSAGADQEAALKIPARIHFLSCEPMLRALDEEQNHVTQKFDWIIFGGESGKNARPCNIDWIRRGLEMCRFYGIAPFVKQLGARPYFLSGSEMVSMRTNRHRDCNDIIKDSHGGDWSEWPEDLRVREFPSVSRMESL